MKKSLMVFLLVALVAVFAVNTNSNAQVLKMSQSFESATFPPAGWTAYNVLGANVWGIATTAITSLFPPFPNGVQCATVDYQTAGGDDWLVTKKVSGIVAGDSLIFWWVKRYSDGPYPPDSCIVRVSTGDSLMPSFTNVLLRINVAGTPVGTQVWNRVTLPLTSFAGQNIFVAFQHKDVDGHGMGLDSITVVGPNAPPPIPSGTWTEQATGLTTALYSVSAVSDDVAWACGTAGKVLRTTNKGVAWTNVSGNIPATSPLYNIYAYDANTAICVGDPTGSAIIYATSNAGVNWVSNTYAGAFGDNLWMTSATDAYYIGDPIGGNWHLLKSTNAGVNWTTWATLPTTNTAGTYNNAGWLRGTNVWFPNVGQSAMLYSSNLGVNWVSQTTPLAEYTATCFTSDTRGLAGGSTTSAGLSGTTNGGTTWSPVTQSFVGTTSISGIAGASTSWWVSLQTPAVWTSSNDGASWTLAYTAPAGSFYHLVKSRTGATLWGVRSNGLISRYGQPIIGVEPIGNQLPTAYSVSQNFPNPFNPTTKINFALPKSGLVTLKVYDVLGKEVASLVNEVKNAGNYAVEFNASALSSGTYFYKISVNDFSEVKRMTLIK
jgi:hypothetical protein